MFAYVTMIST